MRHLSNIIKELNAPDGFMYDREMGLITGYSSFKKVCDVRQYFNGSLSDSVIAAIATTPTTTPTALFTPLQALQYFSLPFGPSNVPFAGQVFRFTFGGIITTPASGTLTITPYYGALTSTTVFTGGVNMGASIAQTIEASLSGQPFRVEGELIFRSVVPTASSSTAWLTGTFLMQGT